MCAPPITRRVARWLHGRAFLNRCCSRNRRRSAMGAEIAITVHAQACLGRVLGNRFSPSDSPRKRLPGIGAERRYCAPGLTQLEYPAVGARAVPYADVIGAIVLVRGGSKPGGRHILRRPDIRRYSNSVTDVFLGARDRGSRLCDAIHLLLARSKRLSNAGSASARGSLGPGSQRKQDFS